MHNFILNNYDSAEKVLNQYNFTMWPHQSCPKILTPNPETMNLKILVRGFKEVLTIHLVFLKYI